MKRRSDAGASVGTSSLVVPGGAKLLASSVWPSLYGGRVGVVHVHELSEERFRWA